MADQEFSSPGAHMASQGSSSSGSSVAYRNPNTGGSSSYGGSSAVIYAPLNKAYNDNLDKFVHSVRNLDDYTDFSHGFNSEYLDWNERLYNDAKSYDMMMSNTAIQRQVKDLIAAGLNPILAANLGGATYRGVNAPYVSLSPGSSLQAYTSYGSSEYATNVGSMTQIEVQKMKNDAQELTNQFNYVMNNENNLTKKDLVKLNQDAQEYLENLKTLNDKELQQFGFNNQKELIEKQNEINERYFNFVNFGSEDKSSFADNSFTEYYRLLDAISRLIPYSSGFLKT